MGAIFSLINTIVIVINILFIAVLILAGVFFYPRIKGLMDAVNAYTNLTKKMESSENKCVTQTELQDAKNKIDKGKTILDELKNYPIIKNYITEDIYNNINSISNSLNTLPICS